MSFLSRKFHSPLETPTTCSRRREEADLRKFIANPPPHVGGYADSEISGLPIRRELTGNSLPAMAAIGQEVAAVHGPDLAPLIQLRHAHQASIGQVHRPIGILCHQGRHPRHLLREIEIQNQIPARNQRQDGTRIGKETARLSHHRVTRGKDHRPPATRRSGPCQQSVSRLERERRLSVWRTRGFVADAPPSRNRPTKSSDANRRCAGAADVCRSYSIRLRT